MAAPGGNTPARDAIGWYLKGVIGDSCRALHGTSGL